MSGFDPGLLSLIVIFIILVGAAWLLSKRQMKSYGEHVAEVKAINDELVAINREMIAELREIKKILKDRN